MLEIKFFQVKSQLVINPDTIAYYLGFDHNKLQDLIEARLDDLVEFGSVPVTREGRYLLNYEQAQIIIPLVASGVELTKVSLLIKRAYNKARTFRNGNRIVNIALLAICAYQVFQVAPDAYRELNTPELQRELIEYKSSEI